MRLWQHVTGFVYSAHDPRSVDVPAFGQRAALYGGRFNPPGLATLYTASTVVGAIAEAAQDMVRRLPPLTLVTYQVDHATVLDLSTPAACRVAGFDWNDVACDWAYKQALGRTPPSWDVADNARAQGAGGIRVASFAIGARDGETNLVFWIWQDHPPNQVRVISDHQPLPGDRSMSPAPFDHK